MYNTTEIFLKDAVISEIHPTNKYDTFSQKYKISRIYVNNVGRALWFIDNIEVLQSHDDFFANIQNLHVGSRCDLHLVKNVYDIHYVVGITNIVHPEIESYLYNFFDNAYNIINNAYNFLSIPCMTHDALDYKSKVD
jgi:hypothetical protein